jgi:putative transposase
VRGNQSSTARLHVATLMKKKEKAEIAISMDGKGAWRDNVFVELLWRPIKYQEVHLHAYNILSGARSGIGKYLTLLQHQTPTFVA